MIHVRNESGRTASLAGVRRAAQAALDAEGCGHLDVSVLLVDDERIRAVHRDHMADDTPTDVITFPLRSENDPDPLLGELVVSVERADAEARERKLPREEELQRYVVHGVLHLLGYDDRKPLLRKKMHARQEEIVAGLRGAGARAASRVTGPRKARR